MAELTGFFDRYFAPIIGQKMADAKPLVRGLGIQTIRPVQVDGSSASLTPDFDDTRLNVSIKDGVINSVISIG